MTISHGDGRNRLPAALANATATGAQADDAGQRADGTAGGGVMRKVASVDAPRSTIQPDPVSLETKYLHLRQPVPLGHHIGGWRVCWLGGWDKQRVFFVVMLVRVKP
jgi:hypothetical protein